MGSAIWDIVAVAIGVSWLSMVGISMLKDKIFMAIGGFLLTATALPLFGSTFAFLPIGAGLALVINGAWRLAKPDSFWARRFYGDSERTLARQRFSGEREEYIPPPPEEMFR